MRILHFLSGLEVGGKERQVLQLCELARESGHASELLLFDTPFRSLEVDFSPGALPVHFLKRGPGIDWRFARQVGALVRELGPDVLHAHNDTALFYAGTVRLLLGRSSPASVGTFHTKPGYDTPRARLATRLAATRLGALTAVSRELAEVLLADRWTGRCDVIWNGVRLDEFEPEGGDGGWRARLDVPAGSFLVGHIGRFDPIKRQRDLVAAARLAARTAPVVAVFVGQGPDREAFTAELRPDDPVRTVERVEDVPAFLRALDAFALCSAHEAAPRVLLEAMATGLPIVATAVGGIPEIAGGEDAAVALVPPGQPERMAAALVGLARDPEARAALGRRARQRVAAFTAEREWGQYAALYAQLSGTAPGDAQG